MEYLLALFQLHAIGQLSLGDSFVRAVCQHTIDGHAAMLAPTAMNQQKFRFELLPDGNVQAACGSGFYTKLDLGIVRYHFEAASGRKAL